MYQLIDWFQQKHFGVFALGLQYIYPWVQKAIKTTNWTKNTLQIDAKDIQNQFVRHKQQNKRNGYYTKDSVVPKRGKAMCVKV